MFCNMSQFSVVEENKQDFVHFDIYIANGSTWFVSWRNYCYCAYILVFEWYGMES